MKSTSEQNSENNNVVNLTTEALEHSVANLSDKQCADIAKVRALALSHAKSKQHNNSHRLLSTVFERTWLNVSIPVAAVFVVAIVVKSVMVEPIPELPIAMLSGDIPTEDLAMLEDLEFLMWLAKNEENMVL